MIKQYKGLVRIHPVRYLYSGIHIDSTLNTLGYNDYAKKFVLLANPVRTNPTNIPVIFRGKNWVVLYSGEMFDTGFEEGFELSSIWIG